MNNQFKCPNCGENSMHIVKTYKTTDSDNYIKCGRCLHVWMQSNRKFVEFIKSALSTIFVSFSIAGLMICYLERWWIVYGIIIGLLMVSSVSNYIVNYKRQ